ncbi:hypothetical protein Pmani_031030 [Petrolisthes manimaculis]|uniref:Uncharacterized protein n=1 Tax=Petrolisthes manimaculis TaxID=1843537 RepID=A0AAE1TT12_9EUCA|nr:hypothetical protein Pmani_031030 [Petrolisthes manimaculis]
MDGTEEVEERGKGANGKGTKAGTGSRVREGARGKGGESRGSEYGEGVGRGGEKVREWGEEVKEWGEEVKEWGEEGRGGEGVGRGGERRGGKKPSSPLIPRYKEGESTARLLSARLAQTGPRLVSGRAHRPPHSLPSWVGPDGRQCGLARAGWVVVWAGKSCMGGSGEVR